MDGDPGTWVRVGAGVELALAAVTALTLTFLSAPYGRHARSGWGPTVPNRVGWILMEAPAPLGFLAWYLAGPNAGGTVPLLLLVLWQLHYVHRTFVFPFRLRTGGKRMPLLIALLGASFNGLNAWINGTWVAAVGDYGPAWLLDPRLHVGVVLFLGGLLVNVWADTKLITLRGDGSADYKIPRGGLYELVSCPNYLGELTIWLGWTIATWSPAGLAFFVYTAANLVPRAFQNHAWYRATFADYPPNRRALVPFVV